MTDVINPTFRDANAEPAEEVVRVLEDALALAREGKLRSVTVVGGLTGNMLYRASAAGDYVEMLGLLQAAQFSVGARLTADDNTFEAE